jgi:hypothetical protein
MEKRNRATIEAQRHFSNTPPAKHSWTVLQDHSRRVTHKYPAARNKKSFCFFFFRKRRIFFSLSRKEAKEASFPALRRPRLPCGP